MNILQFASELIKASIWPVTVLALALVFRTEIRALLGRIKRGKVGPAELEFEATIRSLEDETRTMKTAVPAPLSRSQVGLLTDSDPRTAVIKAWLQVEDAIEQLLFSRAHSAEDVPRNRTGLLRAITRSELLDSTHVALLNELRMLRNQAVHEADFTPSRESVLGYGKLVNEVLDAIHHAAGSSD